MTFHPKTLVKKNNQMLAKDEQFTTGDHNIDLYIKSKVHEKRDKDSEEYWFEKEKKECKFKPKINKTNVQ